MVFEHFLANAARLPLHKSSFDQSHQMPIDLFGNTVIYYMTLSCVCSDSRTLAINTSVNSLWNQPHHLSYDMSSACHPPSLYEWCRPYYLKPNIQCRKIPRGRPETRWGDSIKHDLYNSASLDTTNAALMVFDRPQWTGNARIVTLKTNSVGTRQPCSVTTPNLKFAFFF